MIVLAIIAGIVSSLISRALYVLAEGENIAIAVIFDVIGIGLFLFAVLSLL